MCKFKSAIILKDRIFIPDYDSHSEMLEELKIEDNQKNAERLFVRAELYPKNDDVFSDIDSWEFVVDQDIRPDWFVADYEKQRMIDAVKKWAETHIFINVDNLVIKEGGQYYLKGCKNVSCHDSTVEAYGDSTVKAFGNSTVKAYGDSTVEAWDNSTVKACHNSTVEAWDNSTVKACHNSTVKAWDNSTVKAWDNSTVEAYGDSTVEAYGDSTVVKSIWSSFNTERLILAENSTFKDCITQTLYQSGDYKLVVVTDGKIK